LSWHTPNRGLASEIPTISSIVGVLDVIFPLSSCPGDDIAHELARSFMYHLQIDNHKLTSLSSRFTTKAGEDKVIRIKRHLGNDCFADYIAYNDTSSQDVFNFKGDNSLIPANVQSKLFDHVEANSMVINILANRSTVFHKPQSESNIVVPIATRMSSGGLDLSGTTRPSLAMPRARSSKSSHGDVPSLAASNLFLGRVHSSVQTTRLFVPARRLHLSVQTTSLYPRNRHNPTTRLYPRHRYNLSSI
jgi:hypothetical protein